MKFRVRINRLRPAVAIALMWIAGALVSGLAWSTAKASEGGVAPPTPQAVPLGLPPMRMEPGVELTPQRIELGRKLFFDRRLSFNGTMSCAMCHVPEEGFASNASRRGVGIEGVSLKRNTPSILNVAWRQRELFLDGRETSLISQAWGPLLHIDEMANPSAGYVIEKIRNLGDYRGLFEKTFGAPASLDTVGAALASFQVTIVAADSNFDRWMYRQDPKALSTRAQAGYRLFMGKALCAQCHSVGKTDALFTDGRYHVTGGGPTARPKQTFTVPLAPGVQITISDSEIEGFLVKAPPDLGRFDITHVEADRYAFRTPTLRDIARTSPYMHDGSLLTLKEVVDFYDRGGGSVVGKSPLMKPLKLSSEEKGQLVEFLRALNSNNYEALVARSRENVSDEGANAGKGYTKH
jgi:cytochrome c peroxidase